MTHDVSGSRPDGPIDRLVVRDPAAAAALLDVRAARLLGAFLDEARPVTPVARDLGEDRDALLYRVRRLVALGLLHVAGGRARAGRPLRLYRAAARVYFVPFEATKHETLDAYLEGVERDVDAWVRRNVAAALHASGDGWGLRVARGEDGQMHSKLSRSPEADFAVAPEGPALLSFVYPTLKLDFADAKALQAELLDVFRRYAGRGGAQDHLCRVVLCPVTEPN